MIEAVAIGVSAGGLKALRTILSNLPASFAAPITIVQHTGPQSDGYLANYLNRISALCVKEAEDKETLCSGTAYLAPAGYHLLIEADRTFSLSVDRKVHFSCPAIDVLFESAADAYGPLLAGVILTGANSDGSQGLQTIKELGGLAIIQNPHTAEAAYMPQSALDLVQPDYLVELEEIAPLLLRLCDRRLQGKNTGANHDPKAE